MEDGNGGGTGAEEGMEGVSGMFFDIGEYRLDCDDVDGVRVGPWFWFGGGFGGVEIFSLYSSLSLFILAMNEAIADVTGGSLSLSLSLSLSISLL